ncbi:hypothetical protein [Spiroplasma poulsonii]|nr:hypothetical protein [Spiroplasma poulsonii]UNF61236.1 hypothetical protein MNU24_04795 [Spiroplasma poulsonii]
MKKLLVMLGVFNFSVVSRVWLLVVLQNQILIKKRNGIDYQGDLKF